MVNIDFFCSMHKEYYLRNGEDLLCKKCDKIITRTNGIYDFMFQKSKDLKTEDQKRWDAVFGDVNIFKKTFDALLWKFLPDLLNSYMVSYIVNNYPENSKLIELGCGKGTAGRSLLQKRDYKIVFVDISDVALRSLIKHLNIEDKIDKCAVVKDDFYNKELCFPDQFFDISYNVGVIEHFDDPVKALNNMKRIAKRVICVVPAPSIYFKVGTLIRRIIEKDASQWTEHTYYYSHIELKSIFQKANLKNIQTKQIIFFGHPLCNFATGES